MQQIPVYPPQFVQNNNSEINPCLEPSCLSDSSSCLSDEESDKHDDNIPLQTQIVNPDQISPFNSNQLDALKLRLNNSRTAVDDLLRTIIAIEELTQMQKHITTPAATNILHHELALLM